MFEVRMRACLVYKRQLILTEVRYSLFLFWLLLSVVLIVNHSSTYIYHHRLHFKALLNNGRQR
ncbi:hypothetical protein CBL_06289 [Carabus blaptoides fortunei]